MKKLLLMLVFILALSACGSGSDIDYPVEEYFNATITEVSIDGETAVMNITVGGFAGDIETVVTVTDGSITDFEVTSHSESGDWGALVINDGAILTAIINESSNLDGINVDDYAGLDDEGGATAGTTIEALIDAANAAVGHYDDLFE